jgi:hemerythrin-like domain-containing protein
MSLTLALWHADHVNFGTLLNLLEREVAIFHDGDAADYALMLDIIHYMTRYSDVIHHPKEDLVFGIIRKRDRNAANRVDTLCGQHATLRALGQELARDLDDIVNGSITPRERIEARAREYVTTFREHMRAEEAEMLPLAARMLDETDWASIDEAIDRVEDPLFGSRTQARFVALRDEIRRQGVAGTGS